LNSRNTNPHRLEYIARINRVIDYVSANLDLELPLEKLAAVANFSPFHFHRIFRGLVGETPNSFVQRIRVEKAASQLIKNSGKSITAIALDCGFSGSAPFARVFRETFKMSASQWRAAGKLPDCELEYLESKNGQLLSKIHGEFLCSPSYFDADNNNQYWRITMNEGMQAKVEVKQMPEMSLIYVRHIGPYQGDSKLFEGLFNKLMTWAGPRGLLRFPETKSLCVYHDDPQITDKDKLRTDACITADADTEVDGDVGKLILAGGKYAVARFEVKGEEFQQAWDAVCGGWLPESGYQPEDGPCYEVYHNDPKQHPEGKCIVDICVPVKPL
jgi:AraC family transcriptional regulator